MKKQTRGPGRPPLVTPKPLLLAMAREMLERRAPRWRAACIVAASDKGDSFKSLQSISTDSLVRRLHEAFKKQSQWLLAEAGRQIQFERQHAKATAELEAALARGEVPAWLSGAPHLGAAWHINPEVRDAQKALESAMKAAEGEQRRFVLGNWNSMTPEDRAVEEAMRRAYGPTWLREIDARAKSGDSAYHSVLISSVRPR